MTVELHPGQTFAGYRIEAVAGRGGMGVVYRATQIDLARTVALKLIAPEVAADEAFRERLQRESKLLASIDHPNVIAFYEAGEADGQLFMSVRYVEGMDLRSLIAEKGWLAPERAARIVAQVAAGLDAAHANGLVHRDVKPANVLIEPHDGTHRAYLSDFGLTKKVNLATAITSSGWVGTLDYVAPEQIEGRRVDARADVYALGCVLFQALTGRVPYIRESDAAKMWAHLHEAPPSACELRPELSAEVDRVIARAMQRDPAQRYPSAGDLGRAAIAGAGGEALTEPGHSVAKGAAAPAATGDTGPGAASAAAPPDRRRLRRRAVAGVCALLLVAAAVAAVALTDHRNPGPGAQPRVEHIDLGKSVIPGSLIADVSGAYVLDRRAGKIVKVNRDGVVEGRVKVGKAPAHLAMEPHGDRLWVVNRNDETATEVDASGKRVGRSFRVQADPAYVGVPPGNTVVVLSQGRHPSLLRVDKKTHRPVGRPVKVSGDLPTDLEVDPYVGYLAVTTAFPPAIATYFDPRLRQPDKLIPINTTGAPGDVAIDWAKEVAWVVTSGKDPFKHTDVSSVLRIDMRTAKQIGKPIKVGRDPFNIVIDQGVVWVPATKAQTVARIDENSGRLIGKPIKVGPISGPVAASDGMAWVDGEKDLIRITPR